MTSINYQLSDGNDRRTAAVACLPINNCFRQGIFENTKTGKTFVDWKEFIYCCTVELHATCGIPFVEWFGKVIRISAKSTDHVATAWYRTNSLAHHHVANPLNHHRIAT